MSIQRSRLTLVGLGNSPQHRPPGGLLAKVQTWSTVRGGTGTHRETEPRSRQVRLYLFLGS